MPAMPAPIVLLHGLMASPRVWDPVVPLLPSTHTVAAHPLPWHAGGSPLPTEQVPTFDLLLDTLDAELEAAGLGGAHLVGNSLGGYLALELARRGRARSVVAISPAASWRRPRDIRRVVRMLGFGYRLQRLFARQPQLVSGSTIVRRLLFGVGVAHPERLSAEAIAHDLRAAASCEWVLRFMLDAERRGPLGPAHDLRVPVTVAWALRDRILPFENHARPLFDNLPAVRSVTLPNCGHVPMSDAPELVADVIREGVKVAEAGA